MHLPTALRSCAPRRASVREGLRSVGSLKAWSGGGAAAGRGLEILCLDVTDEGSGGQRPSGGALQQLLHRHLGAKAVHVGAQPAEESGELAMSELLVEPLQVAAQTLVKLRGDHRAERVGGEVAERADRPVNVL